MSRRNDATQRLLVVIWLVCPVAAAFAQRAALTYIGSAVCCVASDGAGNSFAVGYSAPGITVTRINPAGTVVSSFSFAASQYPTAAAVDPKGNLWIVCSLSFPLGSPTPVRALLAKLDPTGTSVLFTAMLGGANDPGGTGIQAIAFDPGGNAYLGGFTQQWDFPLTTGAFQSHCCAVTISPDVLLEGTPQFGFIAKFTPDFTLTYATLIGGGLPAYPLPCTNACYAIAANTTVSALAVDADGVVTAAGVTNVPDFPVTPSAFQTQCQCQQQNSAFVTRINAQGTGLVWSTLLGGSGPPKLPASGGDGVVTVAGLAVDSSGNITITGTTTISNFPVTRGAVQSQIAVSPFVTGPASSRLNGFVAKMGGAGTGLLFSTFYGLLSRVTRPRLDAAGNIWISGFVSDTTGLVLAPNSQVLGECIVTELAADGSSVLFSEMLPNRVAGQDLAMNPDGSLATAGPDGFVLRLPPGKPTGLSILGVADSAVNAVSNTVAPGEFVSFYGTGLGPAAQATFDGIAAPVLYSSDSQINLLVPYGIAGRAQSTVQITTSAGASQSLPLQVVAVQPNIFAVLNSDGSVNGPGYPAAQGSMVSIFVSGAGALDSSLPDGSIASSPAPAPAAAVRAAFRYNYASAMQIAFGGALATPLYAAGIPGAVVNLLRVDAQVPVISVSGPWNSTVAIQIGVTFSPGIPLYVSGVSN